MCPPGVDQTTRSHQRWYIIVPDLLQYHEIQQEQYSWSHDLSLKLFNPKIQWDAWGKFARPAISSPTVNRQLYSAQVPNHSTKLSPLEKLSNELLDMIVGYLQPEKEDTVALGLSSQFLWQIVLHHIHAGYSKSAAPWAGKMIAFQGSYSMDLPEAFDNKLVESITGKGWFGNMCESRRFFWAHQDGDIVTPYTEEAGWIKAAQSHQTSSGVPETCWWTIEEKLGCSDLFPKDREWLLRNLTTRETVSSKMLDGSQGRKTRSQNFHPVSFDDVLLMKTCWTSILSHEWEEKLKINRGAWAGHRFDVVTLETHQKEEESSEWSDASLWILQEAERVRSRVCGRCR